MLNHIMSQIAARLATTLNTTVIVKKRERLPSRLPAAESETVSPEEPVPPKPASPSPTPATNSVVVTATSANIRQGAGNEFPVTTTAKQGDKLTLLGESGDWFNVRLENGQEGWISNRFAK